jgi:benzaldehyde dehydrogenase (NAD)
MIDTKSAIAIGFEESVWRGKVYSTGWRSLENSADVTEPAKGTVLSRVGLASPSDVTRAAQRAAHAQGAWAALPYRDRAEIFRKAAIWIEQHGDVLRPWMMRETGSIAPKIDRELIEAKEILYDAAAMVMQPQGQILPSQPGRLSLARKVPLGVVGVISPFNFPLILSIRAVAPALAVGNAVVLKPDARTSITGGFVLARAFEAAGLPEDLLHVLPGGTDVGEALCADPNVAMIAFTGSTAAGRRVGELCGKHLKKTSLELGGKNSLIILNDADLDAAASNAAFGAWLHQGQICMATGRILVEKSIAAGLVERMAAKANHLPVGDPMTGTVALGPLISESQVRHVDECVKQSISKGAKLEAGGTFERLFYKPTVLSGVGPGMRAFEEEVFGPVASITTFSSDDEAVALANRTDYGLSCAIISKSVGRAMALGNRLRCGLVHINDQTVADEVVNPFGGRGASGNGTSIGGPANWEEFSTWQWVTIKDAPPPYPF